jgi:predicted DCC family thiol-disulfide oxidoreductase YuxK
VSILLFDGDCGFCTTCANWLGHRVGDDVRIVPAQELGDDELADAGLTRAQSAAAAWWLDTHGRAWRGHLAVGKGLEAVGGMWGFCGRLSLLPGIRLVGAGVYRIVVRIRFRLPGGTPACRIPQPRGPGQ